MLRRPQSRADRWLAAQVVRPVSRCRQCQKIQQVLNASKAQQGRAAKSRSDHLKIPLLRNAELALRLPKFQGAARGSGYVPWPELMRAHLVLVEARPTKGGIHRGDPHRPLSRPKTREYATTRPQVPGANWISSSAAVDQWRKRHEMRTTCFCGPNCSRPPDLRIFGPVEPPVRFRGPTSLSL